MSDIPAVRRLHATALIALMMATIGLGALLLTPDGARGSIPPLVVIGLLGVALVLGIAALVRSSKRSFVASLVVLAGAALLPAPFPGPSLYPLLLAVPVMAFVYVEAFLLARRTETHRTSLGTGEEASAAGSPLAAYLRRLPRGAFWTLLLALVAFSIPVLASLLGPALGASVETASVYAIAVGAAIAILPVLGIPLVHAGWRGAGPSTSVVSVVLILLLGGGLIVGVQTASAQGGSADLAVTGLQAPEPMVNTTTTVNVTLTNNGPDDAGPVVVDLELDGQPLRDDGSSSIVYTSVQAGNSTTQSLLWRPSEDQRGEHELRALISTRNPPNDPNTNNDSMTRSVFVRQAHLNVTLLPGETSKTTHPNETVGYRVLLENRGNFRDRANVTVESTNGTFASWVADATRPIGPGEVREIALLTRPPAGADANASGTRLFLNVTSQGYADAREPSDPETEQDTVETPPVQVITEAVDATYDLQFHPPDDRFVDPNETRVTTFTLENNGTHEDLANLTLVGLGGSGAWSLELERHVLILRPGERLPVNVSARAPPSGVPGDEVRFRISSIAHHPPLPQPSTASVEGRLQVSGPDLAIEDVAPTGKVYEGATVDIEATVANQGNRASDSAVLNVTLDPGTEEASAVASVPVPSIDPGEAATVTATWNVTASPGEHTLGAVLVELGPDVQADNDAASGSVLVRRPILVVHPPEGQTGRAGQDVPYTVPPNVFVVENVGNSEENVSVRLSSEHGWLDETRSFTLPAGDSRRVPVTLPIPRDPGTPRDALRLEASLEGALEVSVVNETVTTIEDSRAPEIRGVDVPESVPLSTTFEIRAQVIDDIQVEEVRGRVEHPDGSTEEHAFSRTQEHTYALELSFDSPGGYAITVSARDANPRDPHVNQTAAIPFNVTFVQAPEIEVPTEAGALTVSSGASIPFNVTSPVPLGIVTATAHARTTELVPPYRLETEGWPSGTFPVRIHAEDIFGNERNRTVNVTVDNRLPEIVRFDAERMGEGSEGVTYRFSLHAEHAQSADLVVQRPGSPNRIIAFEGGPERYQLTADLPPGELDVRARAESPAGLLNASEAVTLGEEGGLIDSVPSVNPTVLMLVFGLSASALTRLKQRDG